jgi:SOS-response transcriptional repressor LexA
MKALTMTVPVVTGITAGRSIPDDYMDWQITGFRNVRLIETTDTTARFIAVPVEGDSLKDQGILDGDLLICKITQNYEDGKIGLWQTPSGRTAKFAYYDFDNSVVLHNENGWRQSWDSGELRLLGIVVRVERDME